MSADYSPSLYRPKEFSEMVGQKKLVGEGGILPKILASGNIPSMIFCGPPGTGKTTAASIISEKSGMRLCKLNATTAGISDIRDACAPVFGQDGPVLLYLDEIQYFNKKQQQSLLSYIEDGKIILIASTTENPYYCIYDALLSRCTVMEFKKVPEEDIRAHLTVIAGKMEISDNVDDEVLDIISKISSGDVRRSINYLDMCRRYADGGRITKEILRDVLPSTSLGEFDRDGNVHYDLLSALQKSIRGSDPDAAVFYLSRLLEGGDLLSPCRRLQVIASEDIGPAYPLAAVITAACVQSAKELGLPEAQIPLANAAVILATAPKSNSASAAVETAAEDVKAGKGLNVPAHLQSPLYKGYKYPHNYPGHYVRQQYLPDDIKGKKYYVYGENKTEKAAEEYQKKIKGE